jgi:hypothetical protein
MTVGNNTEKQTIELPLKVGSRITLLDDVDIDSEEGSTAQVVFEGYVEQYVPQTNKLVFEESDIGWAKFQELLDKASGVELYTNYTTE